MARLIKSNHVFFFILFLFVVKMLSNYNNRICFCINSCNYPCTLVLKTWPVKISPFLLLHLLFL